MELIQIGRDGTLPDDIEMNDHLEMMLQMTAENYANVGYPEPWVGYVAVEQNVVLGFCGFKAAPENGRVEIAYATTPGSEGRGIATSMARRLIDIATSDPERPTVFAQTLPEENASTSILKKLGFVHKGSVEHEEDGTVWEWELQRASTDG
ncbi:MAG: GNAT family N-acetyltransferase [Planctomycetota bacterium]